MIIDKKDKKEEEKILNNKEGAGIVDEEVRKEKEIIHKGRPGEIDDEESEDTDLKGFEKTSLN